MEEYYEVTPTGVVPVMMNKQDLVNSWSWLVAHDFEGRLIFENRSRAEICYYERYKMNKNESK